MATCFVIMPFDGGIFEKRYEDIFEPAIRNAGLEPYRVDRDPAAEIPFNATALGIRNSGICFADITANNPNVWYEVGLADGAEKAVVLVCSDERKDKVPFNVQHRHIIMYRTESSQDFQSLKRRITERLQAIHKT